MNIKKIVILRSEINDPLCNGSTADFGSACLGSNPGGSAKVPKKTSGFFFVKKIRYLSRN